jgi:hypothetical protein
MTSAAAIGRLRATTQCGRRAVVTRGVDRQIAEPAAAAAVARIPCRPELGSAEALAGDGLGSAKASTCSTMRRRICAAFSVVSWGNSGTPRRSSARVDFSCICAATAAWPHDLGKALGRLIEHGLRLRGVAA